MNGDNIDPLDIALMQTTEGVLLARCLRERRAALDRVAELEERLAADVETVVAYELGERDERARIRAAVERLFDGWIVDQPDDEEALELERAAVLAIIDREDTD